MRSSFIDKDKTQAPRAKINQLRILALVPTYNEEQKIVQTIKALKSLPDVAGIVVADDCSTDETVEKAKQAGATVIEHENNLGKGQSLSQALSKISLDGYDGLILADGDLGKTAGEFTKLIKTFKENNGDMLVAGFGPPKKKGGFGLVKGLARWSIKRYGGENFQTPLSGQRLLSTKVVKDVFPLANGFGVEVDMTIRALKQGYKVKEVRTEMSHNESGRDIAGFRHRASQFKDVLKVVLKRNFIR